MAWRSVEKKHRNNFIFTFYIQNYIPSHLQSGLFLSCSPTHVLISHRFHACYVSHQPPNPWKGTTYFDSPVNSLHCSKKGPFLSTQFSRALLSIFHLSLVLWIQWRYKPMLAAITLYNVGYQLAEKLGDFSVSLRAGYENVPSSVIFLLKIHLWNQKHTKFCNNSQRFGLKSAKRAT
jgi:hypothetical protein